MTAFPARPLQHDPVRDTSAQGTGAFQAYRRLARLATQASDAGIYLVRENEEEDGAPRVVATGAVGWVDCRAAKLARSVMLSGEPVVLGSIDRVEAAPGEVPIAAFLGIPLGTARTSFHGCLCVVHPESRRWTEEDVDALRDLAGMLEAELLREPLRHERRAIEMAARMLAKAVENMQLGVTITDLAGRIVYTNPAEARMHGYQVDELLGQHARVLGPPEQFRALDMLDRTAASSWTRETVNVRKDGSRFEVLLWSDVVTDPEGEPVGLVTCCEDITERKRAEKTLRDVALRDPLTELPNRTCFHERLARAIERQRAEPERRFAVLFLDLDRFKVVNDSLGHHVGDELLRVVASRLLQCVRPGDTVARFGGDEFAVLLENTGAGDAALRIAERILASIADPVELGGYDLVTSASIGVVQSAAHMTQPEYVWQAADMAMYRAKAAGPGRYEVFDRGMHLEAISRLKVETDLRKGVEQGEFRLEYQPVVHLASGSTAGFEALLRWHHPERGPLLPADFMAVAEETGLILRMGEWVLREAALQAGRLRQAGGEDSPWVAVNIAGKQLGQPHLEERVREALMAAGVDPTMLRLEITEASVMNGAATAADTLRRLKGLGVHLLLDDFGSGFSSLGYLHRLPIDGVKIDRTLIDTLRSGDRQVRVVEGVVRLAHEAGLYVIAEGVMEPEQVDLLKRMGCDMAQGYLFSPAMASDRISGYLGH